MKIVETRPTMRWRYDAFIGYAREDEPYFGSKGIDHLRHAFQQKTGRELRLFIDTEGLENAQLWEQRITLAIKSSAAFIAVVTPRYLHSRWCVREWDSFLTYD